MDMLNAVWSRVRAIGGRIVDDEDTRLPLAEERNGIAGDLPGIRVRTDFLHAPKVDRSFAQTQDRVADFSSDEYSRPWTTETQQTRGKLSGPPECPQAHDSAQAQVPPMQLPEVPMRTFSDIGPGGTEPPQHHDNPKAQAPPMQLLEVPMRRIPEYGPGMMEPQQHHDNPQAQAPPMQLPEVPMRTFSDIGPGGTEPPQPYHSQQAQALPMQLLEVLMRRIPEYGPGMMEPQQHHDNPQAQVPPMQLPEVPMRTFSDIGPGGTEPPQPYHSQQAQAPPMQLLEVPMRRIPEYGPGMMEPLQHHDNPQAQPPPMQLPEVPMRTFSDIGPGGTEPPQPYDSQQAQAPPMQLPEGPTLAIFGYGPWVTEPRPFEPQSVQPAPDGFGRAPSTASEALQEDGRSQPVPAPALVAPAPEPAALAPVAPTLRPGEPEGPAWSIGVPDDGTWPGVDTEPTCQYLEDGCRVIVRCLLRSDKIRKVKSTEQKKMSQFFEVRLPGSQGPHPRFRLQLQAKSEGGGHKQSGFGASGGWGKVQVCPNGALPPHLRDLRVRIAIGRGNCARSWRGPHVASFNDPKKVFELPGEMWNFIDALDDDDMKHLPVVVELSPALG